MGSTVDRPRPSGGSALRRSWPCMGCSRYHQHVVSDASGASPPGGGPHPEGGGGSEARRPLIGELLIQSKVISAEQLAQALSAQREPVNDKKIGQLLIERGWVTEAQLT